MGDGPNRWDYVTHESPMWLGATIANWGRTKARLGYQGNHNSSNANDQIGLAQVLGPMEEKRNEMDEEQCETGQGKTHFGEDKHPRKLKMRIFEGEDAYRWIYRVERYFAVNGLTERESLTTTTICLEGKVLAWYQWRERQHPMQSWAKLKGRLLERFRPRKEGGKHEQFLVLTQEEMMVKCWE